MSARGFGLFALWLLVTIAIGAAWGGLRGAGILPALVTVPCSALSGALWTIFVMSKAFEQS